MDEAHSQLLFFSVLPASLLISDSSDVACALGVRPWSLPPYFLDVCEWYSLIPLARLGTHVFFHLHIHTFNNHSMAALNTFCKKRVLAYLS